MSALSQHSISWWPTQLLARLLQLDLFPHYQLFIRLSSLHSRQGGVVHAYWHLRGEHNFLRVVYDNKGMNYGSLLRPLFHCREREETWLGGLLHEIEWRVIAPPGERSCVLCHIFSFYCQRARRQQQVERCSFTEYKLMSSYLLAGESECVCAVRPQPILTPYTLARALQPAAAAAKQREKIKSGFAL